MGDGQGKRSAGHVEVQAAFHHHPLPIRRAMLEEPLLTGPHGAGEGRAFFLQRKVPVFAGTPEVRHFAHHADRRERRLQPGLDLFQQALDRKRGGFTHGCRNRTRPTVSPVKTEYRGAPWDSPTSTPASSTSRLETL